MSKTSLRLVDFSPKNLAKKLSSGNSEIKATRHNLQWGRRFFHMITGIIIATGYAMFVTHQQAVHTFGIFACVVYVLEQVRIGYPEKAKKLNIFTSYLLRAEEQLKESAAIPYVMALLLTIITFPKVIAVSSIYTLAVADPCSAIIGIRFGKHKIMANKSLEGSLAFFAMTFLCVFLVFEASIVGMTLPIAGMAATVALFSALFEMVPIKVDDNLTIPLFVSICTWTFATLFGIPL